jgi:hypothetical protein
MTGAGRRDPILAALAAGGRARGQEGLVYFGVAGVRSLVNPHTHLYCSMS